jgi:hypothetical protein
MSPEADPQLFSQRLAVVTALTDGDLVPMRNTSDALYAIASDHTKWVKKYLSANDLLAECLGTLLAMDLDVPTAAGGYYVDTSATRWWLSRVIEPAFHWSPQRAQRLAEPKELGAILALDAIIGNRDRHAANIILTPRNTETELRAFSIDVADSWIGSPSDLEAAGLDIPSVANVARGLPLDILAEGAHECADRATKMAPWRVVDSCREACIIAQEPAGSDDRLVAALTTRLQNAPDLIKRYLTALKTL